MDKFYCDICNAPMKMVKKLTTYKTRTSLCRRRKYICTVCDYSVVIYGNGVKDGFNKQINAQ